MNTQTITTPVHEDQIRQQVRKRYGAIARSEEAGCGCASGGHGLGQRLGARQERGRFRRLRHDSGSQGMKRIAADE